MVHCNWMRYRDSYLRTGKGSLRGGDDGNFAQKTFTEVENTLCSKIWSIIQNSNVSFPNICLIW